MTMTWKIVTDSGSTVQTISSPNIQFENVPLLINVGDTVYVDNQHLNMSEFLSAVKSAKGPLSTACPSPDTYAEAFEGADNIICFTLSANLSGSYNSANLGRTLALEKNPNQNIFIFDTHAAGTEMDVIIHKAEELIERGLSFDDVIKELTAYHDNTDIIFLLESVNNLVRNGRVSKVLGTMIGLLGIRLVGVRTRDGRIEMAEKTKGEKRGHKIVVEEMIKRGYNGGKVEISHCLNLDGAEKLRDLLLAKFSQATITICEMNGICSFYAEENGLILGFETL